MSKNYIKKVQKGRVIYPLTVAEMVKVLAPLIDEFRKQSRQKNRARFLLPLAKEVRQYKGNQPDLFKRSLRYLHAKRVKLLDVILKYYKK